MNSEILLAKIRIVNFVFMVTSNCLNEKVGTGFDLILHFTGLRKLVLWNNCLYSPCFHCHIEGWWLDWFVSNI